MTSPRTHGINMKPMKKVTDPQSISANEIPRSSEANPAGEICGIGVDRRDDDDDDDDVVVTSAAGEWSENGIGDGGDRRMLRTRAESS